MTMDEFAAITRSILADAEDGDELVPTACFPARQLVQMLEGVPTNVNLEDAVRTWAASKAEPGEEYLAVFPLDARRFKVVRCCGTTSEEGVYENSET